MNPGEFPVDNQIAQLGGQIEELRLQALSVIAESSDAAALKEARVRFLGKTGTKTVGKIANLLLAAIAVMFIRRGFVDILGMLK